MNTDRILLECLIRVRNMPEMAPLKGYLETRMKLHTDALVGLNEDRALHIAQGMAREAGHLLNLIEQSPTLLDKGRQK